MGKKIEPVHIDSSGNEYYYGTPKNPYNFFPNVSTPMRNLEDEKAIMQGAIIPLALNDKERVGAIPVREYIESYAREDREAINDSKTSGE